MLALYESHDSRVMVKLLDIKSWGTGHGTTSVPTWIFLTVVRNKNYCLRRA